MNKLLIPVMVLLMFAPSVWSRRPKDKAGSITDKVFTDKQYGFQLTLNDAWKVKVEEAKSNYRLILTKAEFAIPMDYQDAPDYTKTPTLVVYADTTSLAPIAFVDSITSDGYKSKQKDAIFKEFQILSLSTGSGFYKEKLIPRQKRLFEVAGERGQLWTAQLTYTYEVAVSASSLGGKRVKSSYGGAIVAVKKGKHLILFHFICEWPYFEPYLAEASQIISSLQWVTAEESE